MAAKKPKQKSADDAMALLREGNDRFVREEFHDPKGQAEFRRMDRREALTTGQLPWCVVLSCADSRVPPEVVFDCGLGDLFTIRVAGNVANAESIASAEYAVDPKIGGIGANLLVVLGHDRCGAVEAAIKTAAAARPGDLGPFVNRLLGFMTPAVAKLSPKQVREFDNKTLSERTMISTSNKAVEANVRNTIEELKSQSRRIADQPGLRIVPAVYRLATGQVDFLGE